MARTPAEEYQTVQDRLDDLVTEGEVSERDADAIRELCDAYDRDSYGVELPDRDIYRDRRKQTHSSPKTLAAWMERLTHVARVIELTGAETAKDVNKAVGELRNGTADHVKDDGLAITTIRNHQFALSKFYRYHSDLGIDPVDIRVEDKPESNGWTDQDMLDKEEIQAIEDAADHPRDLAIFHLLIYTGMRNTALRMAKIKHIDLENSRYYFNTDADVTGLKGIHEPDQPRPLLVAEDAVRQWLKYHPAPDDPEAYLITAKPKWCRCDPHEPVTRETIRYTMQQLAEQAGVKKPTNPHMMRHNFVTICKSNYELPDDTVKFYIGHSPASDVMQTTYSHLSNEKHNMRGEVAAGLRDESELDDSPFTPDACPTCGDPTAPGAKACSRCGMLFTPDAQTTQERVEDAMHADALEAETDEEKQDLAELRELIKENPELLDTLEALSD